jgi:hypothetical protein
VPLRKWKEVQELLSGFFHSASSLVGRLLDPDRAPKGERAKPRVVSTPQQAASSTQVPPSDASATNTEQGRWVPAGQLKPGDQIRTMDGWVTVEAVEDTGRIETVYNLEVEDDHTYFVGTDEWGFSVWAHNAYDVDPILNAAKQAEVEAGLIAAKVDPALAKAIASEGAKPGYAGNELHTLVTGGQLNAANAENFLALIKRDIRPDLAERIATEALNPNYDSVLLRDLANNNHLNATTVVDITALGPNTGPISFTNSQLQKKFKHAVDFGVTGTPNKTTVAAYQAAVEAHVANPAVVEFMGNYHKNPALIFLDPATNQMVLATPAREFISGWHNSPAKQTYARYLGQI